MNTIVKMKNTKTKQSNNEINESKVARKHSHKELNQSRRLARNNRQAVLHAYNDCSEY